MPGNFLVILPDAPNFTIVAMSEAYVKVTLNLREDMMYKKLFEVFPDNPNDRYANGVANLTASLLHVIERHKPHKMAIQKYDIPSADGQGFQERFWSPLNTPVLGPEGELLYIIHQVEDVTEKLKTAEALESQTEVLKRMNAELEQFVQISSHDLQEPLRKIRTYAGLLKVTSQDCLGESGVAQINKISHSAEQMSIRLKSLLQYAYLRKEESLMVVNLGEVLQEVFDDLELLIGEKKANLYVEPLPVIVGIRHQLHQLLYNIVLNALNFSKDDEPPFIQVSVRKPMMPEFTTGNGQQYCEIVIADNGIGFDQQHAERIFTVFERLPQSVGYIGTGIGLALCRKVVHNHNGEIYARGEPGKGAKFHIVLPLK